MRTTILFLLAIVFPASVAVAQSRSANTLEIYVIDVEGGNAVLFAAPSGETVLVDTGNGGDGPSGMLDALWPRSRTPAFSRSIT